MKTFLILFLGLMISTVRVAAQECQHADYGVPLQVAIKQQDLQKVRALLAAGTDANSVYGAHYSMIQLAIAHDNLDIIDALLDHGADPNQIDCYQNNAISELLYSTNYHPKRKLTTIIEIAKRLAAAGVDHTYRNRYDASICELAVDVYEDTRGELAKLFCDSTLAKTLFAMSTNNSVLFAGSVWFGTDGCDATLTYEADYRAGRFSYYLNTTNCHFGKTVSIDFNSTRIEDLMVSDSSFKFNEPSWGNSTFVAVKNGRVEVTSGPSYSRFSFSGSIKP